MSWNSVLITVLFQIPPFVYSTVLVSKAQDYDVLLGQDVLFPIGAVVDNWQGQLLYHPDYRTDGVRLAAIPLLQLQPSSLCTSPPSIHAPIPVFCAATVRVSLPAPTIALRQRW